jgi:hypothetical protein
MWPQVTVTNVKNSGSKKLEYLPLQSFFGLLLYLRARLEPTRVEHITFTTLYTMGMAKQYQTSLKTQQTRMIFPNCQRDEEKKSFIITDSS